MEIVKNEGNRELIYELVYDYDEVMALIKEIIEYSSFKKRGRYFVEASSKKDALDIINNTMIIDGVNTYSFVEDIQPEAINDPCDYWRQGDPRPYSFLANKLIVPELVRFLIRVINNERVDYDWFVNGEELKRKQVLEYDIKNLNSEINEVSNYDTDKKIKMLENFRTMVSDLEQLPNFKFLEEYYSRAKEIVRLELVQETIKYRKRNINNN